MLGRGVKQVKDASAGKQRDNGKFRQLLRSPVDFLERLLSRAFPNAIATKLLNMFRQMEYVRRLIRELKISALVLPADNRYDQSAYVKAAHLEGVGVLVVPQFMAGHLEWAEYVWGKPAYHVKGFRNRLAAIFYPRWRLEYKGRELLSLPGADVITRELMGIVPPLPWVLHSGAADAIAVESEAVKEYCLNEGLPDCQVKVTGSVAHDVLFKVASEREIKKAELLKKFEMDDNLPVMLSSIPPDSLYMGRPECDFRTYRELIEFWCASLSLVKGYNHLAVLHPSLSYQDLKYIEDYGVKIVREPTVNVIPLCDIYVASISSTIQWAIACAIPVVNYDVYRYHYTDYADVGGVITVEEKIDFVDVLLKFANDTEYYFKYSHLQEHEAPKWGVLDGNAVLRLREAISTVTLNSNKECKNG
jgi:hypothetical protein